MTVPVALACARIKLQIVVVRPGGVGRLTPAGAPGRDQVHPGTTVIDPIRVEVGGCAGSIYPHVGIRHAG